MAGGMSEKRKLVLVDGSGYLPSLSRIATNVTC